MHLGVGGLVLGAGIRRGLRLRRGTGVAQRGLPGMARLLRRARSAALETPAKVSPLGQLVGESRLHRLKG
jgi:hypothetical protein